MAYGIANFSCCVRCYDHIYNHLDVIVANVVATVVQFGHILMADGVATVTDEMTTYFDKADIIAIVADGIATWLILVGTNIFGSM